MSDNNPLNDDITEELREAYRAVRGNLMMFAGLLIGLNAEAKDFESAALMFAAIDSDEVVELIKDTLEKTNL